MNGCVAPQAIVPAQGYADPSAVAASLRAWIDIPDLGIFVSRSLPHRGKLAVELSIPVLSHRKFVANDGVIELFTPGAIPGRGNGFSMVYDAFVTDGDRVYMMTGRKYLRPTRLWKVWRLWPETTTMSVILRDVTLGGKVDVDAPEVTVVVPPSEPMPGWLRKIQVYEEPAYRDFHRPKYASGIVRISAGGFLSQLLSMQGTQSRWYARPFVRLRFMMFFAGALFRIYVLGRGR